MGLATVRTLALATGRPVVAISSLEILAAAETAALAAEGRPGAEVLAVIDARRAEVFQQRFVGGAPQGEPEVGRPEDLAPGAGGGAEPASTGASTTGLAIVGDGADRYSELYGPGVRPGRQPSAAVMVALAAGRTARPGRRSPLTTCVIPT